jgi:hypothetical protein
MTRRSTLLGVLVIVALGCALLGGGLGFAAGMGGPGSGGFGGGFSGGHGGFSGGGRAGPAPGGRDGSGGGSHFDGNRGRSEFGHQDFSRGHFPDRGDFHFHGRRPEIFVYPYDPYYPDDSYDPYCDGDPRYYHPRYCDDVSDE